MRPLPTAGCQRLDLSLSGENEVRLSVYDVAGRRIRTLLKERLPAGPRVVVWDALDDGRRPVANGVYFYHLTDGSRREVRRTLIMR
jgi:hypothetical protein